MALVPYDRRSPTLITLGRLIRIYREKATLTQQELADELCYSNGWLSNLETGQMRPRAEQVTALEQAADVPSGVLMTVYKQFAAEGLATWSRPWAAKEDDATILRTFQAAVVPDLLQTEAYASALVTDEALARVCLERQRILTREDPQPPTLHCVLDESVLYQARGGAQVMREQLEHLIASISPTRLTIQVIRSEDNPRPRGGFTIATVAGAEVGHVETAIGGIVTSSGADLADLAAAWEAIRSFALSQRESIELIKQVIKDKWT